MHLWLPAVAIALGMPPPESRELMLAGTLDGRLGIHMTLKIDAWRSRFPDKKVVFQDAKP